MSAATVIVIGSNSTRCVSADLNNPQDQPVRRRVETRLFLGMRDGMLSAEAIEETAQGIRRLIDTAEAPMLGVYATSAVRDAKNAGVLARRIEALCALPLTVLSGPEEAAASFYGVSGSRPALMVDIGGGSTEIAMGRGLEIRQAISLQLGASRLFQAHPIYCAEDAEPALEAAREILADLPEALALHEGTQAFYSVGGTGTACAMLAQGVRDRAQCEGYILTRETLREQLILVSATPREQRVYIPGFPPSRLDILPTGMAILSAVMDRLRLREITVTRRCNADGLLRMAAEGRAFCRT